MQHLLEIMMKYEALIIEVESYKEQVGGNMF